MKQIIVLSSVLFGVSVLSVTASAQETTTSISDAIQSEIKAESTGSGRIHIGGLAGIGYDKSIGSDANHQVNAMRFEVGGLARFTPFREWLEIEVGIVGTIGGGGKDKEKSAAEQKRELEYGLRAIRAYAGPIFPIGQGTYAVGLGVYTDLSLKAEYDEETIATYKPAVGDYNIAEDKLSKGFGAYIEGQKMGGKNDQSILFLRLNLGQFEREHWDGKTTQEKFAGISLGMKYKGLTF